MNRKRGKTEEVDFSKLRRDQYKRKKAAVVRDAKKEEEQERQRELEALRKENRNEIRMRESQMTMKDSKIERLQREIDDVLIKGRTTYPGGATLSGVRQELTEVKIELSEESRTFKDRCLLTSKTGKNGMPRLPRTSKDKR